MDLAASFSSFVYMIIVLPTKPFFLSISACLFGLRTAFIVVHMSLDLVNMAVSFHVNIFWRAVVGTINLLLLPLRLLTAIPRERLLERCVHEMQFEVENLEWERKEIEENLQEAIKEYKVMETELTELEEEHEKAISRIERLETELQDLKKENIYLKETPGKGHWRAKSQAADSSDSPDELHPSKSSYNPSDRSLHSPTLRDQKKAQTSKDSETAEILGQERKAALSQSMFSVFLAILVGIVMFEAKEPRYCTPLVVALFTVVGISLKTAVRFFFTIKNNPASDAVALLSLNWFILGALTYPALPKLAGILAPKVSGLVYPRFWLTR